MTPTDLLAKLEEAECGSPALNEAVHAALGRSLSSDAGWHPIDPYTTSSEDALALFPTIPGYPDVAMTCTPQLTWLHTGGVEGNVHGTGLGIIAKFRAKTAALCLCGLALRARAVMGGGKT